MTHLKLNSNLLTGGILNGMYKLTHLEELLLNSNLLNSTLSAKPDQWEDLKVLMMYKNSLAGPFKFQTMKKTSAINAIIPPTTGPVQYPYLVERRYFRSMFNTNRVII